MKTALVFAFALIYSVSLAQTPPVPLKDGIVKRTSASAPAVGADCTGAGQSPSSVPAVFITEGADKGKLRCCNTSTELWEDCTPAGGGGGGVTGPGSSTDNSLVRFSGTAGSAIDSASSNLPTLSDTGALTLESDLDIPKTIGGSGVGVIYKDGVRFLHNYAEETTPTNRGGNTFLGESAGNFTMGGANDYNGSRNTGVGQYALDSITSGYYNTAFGWNALTGVTTGQYNSCLGPGCFQACTSCADNTGAGQFACGDITNGTLNVCLGEDSGGIAPASITTGDYNVFVGAQAGVANSGLQDAQNCIAIGYQAQCTASNQVVLGNASVTATTLRGTVSGTFSGALTGNASTASALAGNGANCSAGSVAGGVDASGISESCIDPIVSTEIDTSAELAGILGDETGSSGGFVRADGPTFGNSGATFGSGIGQTETDTIKIPQYGYIRSEVPTLADSLGSTAFVLGSSYAEFDSVRDNTFGLYYNARAGMSKLNVNEWAIGSYWETNYAADHETGNPGVARWFEWNIDYHPEPEGAGSWRPFSFALDTNALSGDGAIVDWSWTPRRGADKALTIRNDSATGATGGLVDFNYGAELTGAGKTRAHFAHTGSAAQAAAYAFSAARVDKGTNTDSHAREYGAVQAIVNAASTTASHDYGYMRGNRTELNLTGSGTSQTGEEVVGFSTRITVNPSAASHNYDDVYGLNVEWDTTRNEASIITRAAGVRIGAWATTTTNRQADYRYGVWLGDQKCPEAAAGDQCAAIQIDAQTNGDGSAGNLNFGGGDYASGHITFRNGYVHLYNSADSTYSFNTSSLRLTRDVGPAVLGTRSGGLVATANGGTAASATTVTIEDGDHWLQPTGSTAITTINTCDTANKGKQLVVMCGAYTGTITNTTGNLRLTGDLACTSNDTLSLICDGTNWLETSRSVNG